MQYQVLARKWRPQTFGDIVGQEHVSRTLLNALQSGRIAHAFLFSGPRGSGKTSTARILAKALNCHKGKPGEPCGSCASCEEIAAGNCIDVLEIDAASNTGVDNVRQLIEQARYQPARDRYKIFIIDEVHMLSNSAFSALLKTLEEPPAHVAFIMATTEYNKIPATILSRCQQYSFKLIPYPLILDRLRTISKSENIEISDGALEQVVFSSGGSMRDAMSALDQVIAFSGNQVKDGDVTTLLGLVETSILGATVRAIASNDVATLLALVGDLVETGQDLQGFCRRLIAQFRNLTVLKAGVSDPAFLGIPESLLPDLREQAALFSKEDLLRLFETLVKIDSSLKFATQMRFQLEMGLIELAHVGRLRSLEELISEFSVLAGGDTRESSPGAGSGAAAGAHFSPPAARKPAGAEPALRGKKQGENPSGSGESQDTASGDAVVKEKNTGDPDDVENLLDQVASAVGREPLESLLRRLEGARLHGDSLILEMQNPNGFFRSRIRDNMHEIAQAAKKIIGKKVQVLLKEVQVPAKRNTAESPNRPATSQGPDILRKAKKEPVVQSFLDVFPGQVKAEKIDP